MNLNTLNQIISNEESRDLPIEIIINNKVYSINSIESDFDRGSLKIYPVFSYPYYNKGAN
tara:strand:+ start:5191 stop:5370 length:180 start_codon:yes stop_codon:yes gene_type:complete